jgi:hypothetical protein
MRPNELILRCYAKREANEWVAVCVDLSLAAQGDTYDEARKKLDAQIREYVFDALVGEDRQHAVQLFSRRAPWSFLLRYWALAIYQAGALRFGKKLQGVVRFREALPLVPALC